MAAAHNAYLIAKDVQPQIVAREWPQFQDFLEDLADNLIGDFSSSRNTPLQPIPNPSNRHLMDPKLFEKKKTCQGCRAKDGPGQRVTVTLQGCQLCQTAVCKACVADHIQRGNVSSDLVKKNVLRKLEN